jgi:hypothetical protein
VTRALAGPGALPARRPEHHPSPEPAGAPQARAHLGGIWGAWDAASAWRILSRSVVAAFAAFILLLLIAGQGASVMAWFPALALAIGMLLYFVDQPLYLGFCWWLWFLVPEVRRLVDYETTWHTINPVMVAPFFVSGLCLVSAFRYLPMFRRASLAPFALILASLVYSTVVGVIVTTPEAAAFGFLNWAVPVGLAFHIAARVDLYPAFQRVIRQTFIGGALVMGGYGLIQYFFMPPWDAFWLNNCGMINQGRAVAQEVRVFSTLNSSGPFSFVLVGCLMQLFSGSGKLRLPAAVVGYCSLFLSLVRAAWLAWIVGFVFLIWRSGWREPKRLVVLAGIALVVLPVAFVGPVAPKIQERFDTLYTLDEDDSYQQRRDFYVTFLSVAVDNFAGAGIGSTGVSTKLTNNGQMVGLAYFDSGLMQVPFVLGWAGAAAYLIGLALLGKATVFRRGRPRDPAQDTMHAIVLAVGSMMIFENSLIGVEGVTFWSCLGLAVAARRHVMERGLRLAAPEAAPGPQPTIVPGWTS